MSDVDTLDVLQADYLETQDNQVREEIKEELERRSEFVLDLENLPKQEHRWVDRGAKYTCEIGTHPTHEAWKKRK